MRIDGDNAGGADLAAAFYLGPQFGLVDANKAQAETFLSDLRQAAKNGEAFDTESGLPESMMRAVDGTSWLAYVVAYVDRRWPSIAAHTRSSMVDALGTVTASLVRDLPGRPEARALYRALALYALPPTCRSEERPPKIAAALRWLDKASLPVSALEDLDHVERALNAIARRLDESPAAATTIARKRAVFLQRARRRVDR